MALSIGNLGRATLMRKLHAIRGIGAWIVLGACSAQLSEVADPVAVRIIVSPDMLVPVSASVTIAPTAYDQKGGRVAKSFSFSSSDSSVARVDKTGRISGIAVGDAVVSIRADGALATEVVHVRPSTMRIVVDSIAPFARDDTFLAKATFLDALGVEVPNAYVVEWTAADENVRIEFVDPPLNHTVRLRATSATTSQVTARGAGFTQVQRIYRYSDVDDVLLTQFFVSAGPYGGTAQWWYAPILFATSRSANVAISRVTFTGSLSKGASCGFARPEPYAETPLYDFQPYNWVWFGPPPVPGEIVRADVELNYGGVKRTISISGPVTINGTKVFDFGTNGFAWADCP